MFEFVVAVLMSLFPTPCATEDAEWCTWNDGEADSSIVINFSDDQYITINR